jgi:hypothetical protein
VRNDAVFLDEVLGYVNLFNGGAGGITMTISNCPPSPIGDDKRC